MLKANTLKQNVDFHRVYSAGKSRADSVLVTYALKKKKNSGCRIGITTSKKIGGAVERNRCRRIIRAACVSLLGDMTGDWDIVFVARFRTKSVKSNEIASVMRRQLAQLGVISG